eukprot:COSAG03_NODE_21264_length_306_cov_1.429952_1_plen_73_part_10
MSLEPRKGRCADSRSMARMHSFSASRDLFISAPSMRVYSHSTATHTRARSNSDNSDNSDTHTRTHTHRQRERE